MTAPSIFLPLREQRASGPVAPRANGASSVLRTRNIHGRPESVKAGQHHFNATPS
jgi:hypothetical protein